MVVASYGEGEAAMDFWMLGINIWTLQRAAGQHGLLRTIECNVAKLFPVADQVSFNDNFMECQSALSEDLVYSQNLVKSHSLTSLSISMGT